MKYGGNEFFQGIITYETDYDCLLKKYNEKNWQEKKYESLAEVPGTIVYDYEPQRDRFTIELSRKNGRKETLITENFVREIENHPWLDKEGTDKQKKVIREAMQRPMSGSIEFKGRFCDDQEYHWYRSHFTSLADERGRVYRLVGRAVSIEDETEL